MFMDFYFFITILNYLTISFDLGIIERQHSKQYNEELTLKNIEPGDKIGAEIVLQWRREAEERGWGCHDYNHQP